MARLHTCTADHLARNGSPHNSTHFWQLWRGCAQWFICGPGPAAMLPCSAADYTGRAPKMTSRESRIAHKALQTLEARHHNDLTIGPKEIQHILTESARR
jgi:hypothetical protein